jgi:hypothetical protein
MRALTIGQTITTIVVTEAYYSGYGGLPPCSFCPGDVGTVVDPDLIPVFGRRRWVLLDFTKDGREWRAAIAREHARPV